ncbi:MULTISPECIES: MFS transporter [unclassified Kitasatospora]|uniref:MFS transporter n=1 Tax=unclassified Kitasatospora TaxID=2633591 RepID=UPI000708D580|nr:MULTISPECIES: MFS transporter [unclassified Kitasatospora]KQV17497.1 MFS transporter [Kitasatospora sp. Root107]KRB69256.1 MFS transporter [Kitasatospora sp. Root187]
MLSVLRNRTYRRLFTAQVVALAGTGLATVALSLLAYDLAGDGASAVLGTALAIKMVTYVAIAPVIGASADRIPRRVLMAAMDLTRAAVALALPFVTQVWQIYLTVFLLQAASAAFTPTFQATIPQVLPAERDYTQALSMSRLAYDLESLLSPALAAVLLSVVSYNWLFAGTTLGFVASAALVLSAVLPRPSPAERTGGIHTKATYGIRLFWHTPRLRALLALDLAVASAGAVVFVNTVVVVQGHFGRPATAVSLALAAFGTGSILTALALPPLLRKVSDRAVMLPAAYALAPVLAFVAAVTAAAPSAPSWLGLLAAWAAIGAATSAVLTPGGRIVRRSVSDPDLPAAFAAQFSLSHSCWLLTYPLAGRLAAGAGLPVTAGLLAAIALAATVTASLTWPAGEPAAVEHLHPDLAIGHPHLADAQPTPSGWRHSHVLDQHRRHRPRAAA